MKLSRKILISLGVVFAAVIVGGCVAISIVHSGDDDGVEISALTDIDFRNYYEETKKESDQFSVESV